LIIAGLLLSSALSLAASPQDFTLGFVFKNPDGKAFRVVKHYLANGVKYRVDYLDPDGAANMINIYRKDKGLYWSLDPGAKTYVEKKLDQTEWDYAMMGVLATETEKQKRTGETRFLNHPCDIYEAERSGFTTISYLVQNTDVVLRSELKEKGKIVQIMEATVFDPSRPAASLFEIPAGYKKVAGQ